MGIEESILSKVLLEPTSGCWLWMGAMDSGGYGNFRGKGAHRISYQTFKCEEIPAGMDLDHLCRIRSCVNPEHLEPVTRKINCLRGFTGHVTAAKAKAITHCPQGHEYTAENTYLHGRNRKCKICKRAAVNRWAAKNREKLAQYCREWRRLQSTPAR